jgi:hypothetical protein
LGRVAEWFKAPVLKTGVPARVPWVRIPPLPPDIERAFATELISALNYPSISHGALISCSHSTS